MKLWLGVLQLNVKKLYVYGAIAVIWIVIPALEITFTAVTTDIIQGTCRRFPDYQSHVIQNSIGCCMFFISYLLPLALMVFCYVRIVHKLRSKVSLLSMVIIINIYRFTYVP